MARVNALLSRYDACSYRERIIILAAVLIMTALSWYLFLGEQQLVKRSKLASEIQATTLALEQSKSALGQRQLDRDSTDDTGMSRLNQLQQRSVGIQGMIDDYAAELISPTEMARLLETVLSRQKSLKLKRLGNIGAEDLLPAAAEGQQRLYRHRFEMELEGPYLDCLAYLQDLEALPWRIYWQTLEIDVIDYPINRILIEVATLSLQEDWIGV